MQQASMNLTESLHEVYEPDWHGKDDVLSIGKVSATFLLLSFSYPSVLSVFRSLVMVDFQCDHM